MRKRTIVVEGLPASGKTTLAEALNYDYSFEKVHESLGKLGGVWLTDDQKVIFREMVKKYTLAKRSRKSVVIDRGYLSMLAWDYCAEKLGLAKDLVEKQLWVQKALVHGQLFEPDLYVYLMATPDLSLFRRPREEITLDVWSGVRGMRFYDQFCQSFFCEQRLIKSVLFLDASPSIDETIKKILRRLDRI